MIEDESEQWISEFHPTVEKDVLEVLRSRVQYSILDQLNYMISNHVATPDEVKKIVLNEITEIVNEPIDLDTDEN
jgi:ATP:corrinoid adenosyltransferase